MRIPFSLYNPVFLFMHVLLASRTQTLAMDQFAGHCPSLSRLAKSFLRLSMSHLYLRHLRRIPHLRLCPARTLVNLTAPQRLHPRTLLRCLPLIFPPTSSHFLTAQKSLSFQVVLTLPYLHFLMKTCRWPPLLIAKGRV